MNPFIALADMGYPSTVPIIPPDAPISEGSSLFKRIGTRQDGRGKTPGVKGYDGNWFSFDWVPHVPNAQDYDRWHAMGAGVGIKTGHGIIAIDADTLDQEAAAIVAREVSAFFGKLPIRTGRAPKHLYLLRISETPVPYMRVDFGQRDERGVPERVEILSEGRQFVAQGIHPKTLLPYQWDQPLAKRADLPVTDLTTLNAFMARLKDVLPAASEIHKSGGTGDYDQEELRGEEDLVRRAVQALPNDARFDTRESYLNIGYAIRAAIPDDEPTAFEIFADWCDRWEQGSNPRHVVEADWRRMKPPYRRGAQWLYQIAEDYGQGQFKQGDAWFEPIPEPTNPFAEIALNSFSSGGPVTGRFVFKPFAAASTFSPEASAPSLIKGLLDQGAMSVLYGDSNAGKTFVALDLCYHIATGQPYAGLRTSQGVVAYIAAEGGRGAEKRLAALRKKFPDDTPEDVKLALLTTPVDLLRPDADLKDLVADLRAFEEKPALIVVDTLSRALAGGDENSSVDMGALVKHLDVLRAATGAHVMAVHHTGKDKARGARGHSLLRAATDTEIEVADAGLIAGVQTGSIGVTKQRDLDKSWGGRFALDVWPLGLDLDGDVVTSCTIKLLDDDAFAGLEALRDAERKADGVGGAGGGAGGAGTPTDTEQTILDALGELEDSSSDRVGGWSLGEISGRLGRRLDNVSSDGLRIALARMVAKNLVEKPKRAKYKGKFRTTVLCSFGENVSHTENETNKNEQDELFGIFS